MDLRPTEHQLDPSQSPLMILTWNILEKIICTIGMLPSETGGVLGRGDSGEVISHFHFDQKSNNSAVTYTPDNEGLNRLFEENWNPFGIRFCGFVHSHPGLMSCPSYGDSIYAERIFEAIGDLEFLWLPIVLASPDTGCFRFVPWAAYRNDEGVKIVQGKVCVVNLPPKSKLMIAGQNVLDSLGVEKPLDEILIGKIPEKSLQADCADKTFDRVEAAYNLPLMAKTRLFVVGAGGSAEWAENMARAGIGQFVLVDPDIVSATNIATQQVYRKDIGRFKVDSLAERIRDIFPASRVVGFAKNLEELSSDKIRDLLFEPIDGQKALQTIVCGFTDSFFTQALINRIALNFGLPSLCAQVYYKGRGAEITFTHPKVTPACHRCILRSRYEHFLEKGQDSTITSDETPIFATNRLNSIKGFIALALIHAGTSHPRWGNLLNKIGNRNLVQIRMDPDIGQILGLDIFERVFEGADRERICFDETLWLAQAPESSCPDCGGTGDLGNCIGKFKNTLLDMGRKGQI